MKVSQSASLIIVALTEMGRNLGEQLKTNIPNAELWFKPTPFGEKIQQAFVAGHPIIMICATGIAVRTLAPVLRSKQVDPPVLVMDEFGKFVVPLLSGHEGGANQLAAEVAEKIGAQLVLTTVNTYLEPIYTLGMGCERNCTLEELTNLMLQSLDSIQLKTEQLSCLASIDIKSDELGLIALAKQMNKPFETWSKDELGSVESFLHTKSDYVFKTVGVYAVAESAALYAAKKITNSTPELLLVKQKSKRATSAIARAYYSEL